MTNKNLKEKCPHELAYKCAGGIEGKNPFGFCDNCSELVSLKNYEIMRNSFKRIGKENRQLYKKIKKKSQMKNKLLGIVSHH